MGMSGAGQPGLDMEALSMPEHQCWVSQADWGHIRVAESR